MRLLFILFFLIMHLGIHAQYENKLYFKKTYQKFYSEKEKDTIRELISIEELDKNGKLVMKSGYTPNENLPYTCEYHYRDTFLFKKVITRKKFTEYDTATYVDSVIREIPSGYNPFFKQSYSRDNSGNKLFVPRILDEGHQLIITTHYETRDDSRLEFDYATKKNKMKRSFYQLVHEYFIEYDSTGRNVAEYSSIDKWEYDKVNFRKYQYDENGFLEATIFMNENADYMESGDTLKIKNIISDTVLTFPEFWNGVKGFYHMNVYSTSKKLIQSVKLPDKTCLFFNSFTIYSYDENGRLIGEQNESGGDTKSEKTYSYLNRNSLKIIEIKTRSQLNKEPIEFESEIFKYNSNNHLLIEQFEEKNGIKSNWFTYEYTFH